MLYVLAGRPGEVVTKSELFRDVWRDSVVTDSALSSCIRELRRALNDDAKVPRFIETIHRRGFRLRLPSTLVSLERQAGSVESTGCVRNAQPSIVVLPFEYLGRHESGQAVARGLVHDIITRIARSRAMLIIARGTAFQFAGGRHDVKAVARKLRVRYVVQGALQVSGNKLNVIVALAEGSSRRELWSERYHRKLDDFMRIQDEIAEAVVSSLESEVQRDEVRRSLLMPSSNLDAWSAYHRGVHHMYRFTPADCDIAEELFLRSIRMEPGIPRPYAGLSFINFERAFLGFDKNRAARIRKSFDYALQSLSIDPLDPMGHWALSRAYLLQAELPAAKESLQTALELNPSYAIAQYSLGWVGLQLGENELCIDRVGFARRLSPYDPLKFAMLGVYALNLALMGRTAEAAQLSLRSTRQANVHHQALAFAAVTHALDGQTEQARAFFERIRSVAPRYGLDDFLAAFPFQLERDLKRVSEAFALITPSRRRLAIPRSR